MTMAMFLRPRSGRKGVVKRGILHNEHLRSRVNAAADDGGLGETRPTAVVPLAHRSLAR